MDPISFVALTSIIGSRLFVFIFIFLNGIIGNSINIETAKIITFYKTHSGLGLLISTAYNGSYVAAANNDSTFIYPDRKFPSSKSNCTILNKWHVISVTWSNRNNLSNCWSNGEKLMTFTTGNVKSSYHCFIGDLGTMLSNAYLTGCIGEIIGFYRSLTDMETSYIHQFLIFNLRQKSRDLRIRNLDGVPNLLHSQQPM